VSENDPSNDAEFDEMLNDCAALLLSIKGKDVRNEADRAQFRRQIRPMMKRGQEYLADLIIERAVQIDAERRREGR
jgi:hypothetical protein